MSSAKSHRHKNLRNLKYCGLTNKIYINTDIIIIHTLNFTLTHINNRVLYSNKYNHSINKNNNIVNMMNHRLIIVVMKMMMNNINIGQCI